MAKFNPDTGLSPTSIPSGLGYSQGIGTDETFKTLFTGLGNAVSGFANAVDEQNKTNIYKDTRNAVDQVQSVFGVDAATNANEGGTPDAIKAGGAQMTTLQKAYQSGAISDVYYYTKLNDIVKGLRAKYPGYDKEIDSTISSITGVTPANAIVAAIQRDAMEGQAAEASRKAAFYQNEADNILKAHQDWKGPGDTRWSYEQLVVDVGNVKKKRQEVTDTTNELQLKEAQGKATAKDYEDAAKVTARNLTNQYVSGALSTIGTNFQEADKTLKGVGDGSIKLDGNKTQQLSIGLQTAKTQVEFQLQRELSKPINPDDPNSKDIWSQLTTEQQNKLIADATRPITSIINAFAANDFGIIRATNLALEVEKNGQLKALYDKYPVMQLISTLSTAMGPNFEPWFNNLLQQNSDLNSKVVEMIHQALAINPAAPAPGASGAKGTPPPPSINTLIHGAAEGDPSISATTVRTTTTNMLKVINDPNQSLDTKSKNVAFLFHNGGGFDLTQFNDDEAGKIYSSLVTPEVSKNIKLISDQSNPEIWKSYSNWAYKNFNQVFGIAFNDLKHLNDVQQALVDVKWDESGRFNVTRKPIPSMGQGPLAGGLAFDSGYPDPGLMFQQDTIMKHYSDLNVAVNSFKNVLQLDGKDVSQSMTPYLQMLGVNPAESAPAAKTKPQAAATPMADHGKAYASYAVNDLVQHPGDTNNYAEGDLVQRPGSLAQYASNLSGLDFVASLEGFAKHAAPDGPQWSIGYGTKATPDEIKNKTPISPEEAKARLAQELTKAGQYVDKVAQVPLNPNQHLALAAFVYNTGHIGPGMLQALNSGDMAALHQKWMSYTNSSVPGTKQGLINRRQKEWALFSGQAGGQQVAMDTTNMRGSTNIEDRRGQPPTIMGIIDNALHPKPELGGGLGPNNPYNDTAPKGDKLGTPFDPNAEDPDDPIGQMIKKLDEYTKPGASNSLPAGSVQVADASGRIPQAAVDQYNRAINNDLVDVESLSPENQHRFITEQVQGWERVVGPGSADYEKILKGEIKPPEGYQFFKYHDLIWVIKTPPGNRKMQLGPGDPGDALTA